MRTEPVSAPEIICGWIKIGGNGPWMESAPRGNHASSGVVGEGDKSALDAFGYFGTIWNCTGWLTATCGGSVPKASSPDHRTGKRGLSQAGFDCSRVRWQDRLISLRSRPVNACRILVMRWPVTQLCQARR